MAAKIAKRRGPDPQLVALAMAMEIPDCKCPQPAQGVACMAGRPDFPRLCPGRAACKKCPPVLRSAACCPHARAADELLIDELFDDATVPPGLTRDQENDLLHERFHAVLAAAERHPPGHDDSIHFGPAPVPKVVLSREARINLLALRRSRGEQLFSEHDVTPREAMESICIDARTGRGPKKRQSAEGVRRSLAGCGPEPEKGIEWVGYPWKEKGAGDGELRGGGRGEGGGGDRGGEPADGAAA